MAKPRISVITPSYNQACYLERAICSVLDQGYRGLEYLIADAGSDDGSADLVRMYADELAWHRIAPDRGPADGINACLERATGELVLILHADDVLLPGALEEVAASMFSPDAPAWAAGRCLRIDGRDEALGQFTAAAPESLLGFLMHDTGMLPPASTVYRREALDAAGPFNVDMRYGYRYDMACRLLAAGLEPAVLKTVVAATREASPLRTAEQTLRLGEECIEAAERSAEALPMRERYALWRNCDERRRIYALAASEAEHSASRRHLWQQLLRRPWWLASDRYRKTLLAGAARPAEDRRAA